MKRHPWSWIKTLRSVLALIVCCSVGTVAPAGAAQNQQDQTKGKGKIEVLHVQGNVYMIAGAGANITLQVGDEVAMVVDAGTADMSDQVLAAIRSVTDKHIIFVIDTSDDPDHTGGNEAISNAGWALPNASQNPLEKAVGTGLELASGAAIVGHVNMLDRMSAQKKMPQADWPTDTYENDEWKLYNNEGVFIFHPPAAHTDGDSFVLFRGSDVVSAGDILNLSSYPVIRAEQGGNINGFIDALNQMLDLLIAKDAEEGGTLLIPGHGRICDRNDVVNYRDMATIVRARVQQLIDQGKTLQQIEAAKPTFDYDGEYAGNGPWTANMFVDAIYRDLSKGKNKQQSKAGGDR
jgi:glyoxylase-like metal-dependent hydrolase (beta-lactamase superfamily II)